MSETLCQRCPAVCCRGPLVLSLTLEERAQMRQAGTRLITVAKPVDHDREKVIYPVAVDFPLRRPVRPQFVVEKGREYQPLAAGLGRYVMLGTCGNLETVDGREQCSIYDERPKVCRDFEMGGAKCHQLRQQKGVEPQVEGQSGAA